MDAQHDLSEDMSLRETLVGLGSFDKRICFRNRHLKLRGFNGGIELLEFADAGDAIIGNEFYASSFLRVRLDTIWIGKPVAGSQRFEGVLELIAAGKRENCIDSVVRETPCRLHDILTARVDRLVGTHVAHQF